MEPESESLTKVGEREIHHDIQSINRWKRALRILSVVSVLLLLLLISLVTWWHIDRKARVQKSLEYQEGSVCVPNESFDSNGCPDGLESRTNSCCGTASKILSIYTKKLTLNTFTEHSATRMLSDKNCGVDKDSFKELMTHTPVMALLSGLDKPRIEAQGEGTLLFWNETSERTVLNNLTNIDGHLKIPTDGFYYVYSQVVLDKDLVRRTSKEPFFSHQIYRTSSYTIPRRQMILETSNSACNIASPKNQLSVSVGSVFKLEEGDLLSVETSHPQSVVPSHESNHFGLHSV